jgi:phage tail tube protein FII
MADSFIDVENHSIRIKTISLPPLTDKVYHKMLNCSNAIAILNDLEILLYPMVTILHKAMQKTFGDTKDVSMVCVCGGIRVFNATFNNISVISWRSVLLVEDTGVPKENHRPASSH